MSNPLQEVDVYGEDGAVQMPILHDTGLVLHVNFSFLSSNDLHVRVSQKVIRVQAE